MAEDVCERGRGSPDLRISETIQHRNRMIGPILVTLLVAVIVSSYILIVNRMLRSDEHWSESNQVKPNVKATVPASSWTPATPAHA
jgi:hypothetical protein